MPMDRARAARGALAGAVAAGIWAAQQPLDRRVFAVDYDDCALLGSAVTRGRLAYPLGVAMHLANGALFGALYSQVAPSLPGRPGAARGLAAGLAEHALTWPGTRLLSHHPAAGELPQLWGSRPALAQATWRHALFGAVLGALERRLNPPADEAPDHDVEIVVSTNGHGNVEHLAPASS
jgi:hypothetical protein